MEDNTYFLNIRVYMFEKNTTFEYKHGPNTYEVLSEILYCAKKGWEQGPPTRELMANCDIWLSRS